MSIIVLARTFPETNQDVRCGMIAVLTVYAPGTRSEEVIALQLSYLSRSARRTPFTHYCAAARCDESARSLLRSTPNVRVVALPATERIGSQEHGYYLDLLLRTALSDSADFICTLDSDAFPVRSDWLEVLQEKCADDPTGVVSVFRAENGDTMLPHPSCIAFHRSLFEKYPFSFSPVPSRPLSSQAPDTGVNLGLVIEEHNLAWQKLVRSNAVNDHPLLGGIYGGLVFHLGASSRSAPLFRQDAKRSRRLGLYNMIRRRFPNVRARSLTARLLSLLLDVRAQTRARNRAAHERILSRLLEDPDGYLNYLSGSA